MKKRIERLTRKIEEVEPLKPVLILFCRGEVFTDNNKNKSYSSIEAALADNPECEQNIDEVVIMEIKDCRKKDRIRDAV